jgi:hypothetical protein
VRPAHAHDAGAEDALRDEHGPEAHGAVHCSLANVSKSRRALLGVGSEAPREEQPAEEEEHVRLDIAPHEDPEERMLLQPVPVGPGSWHEARSHKQRMQGDDRKRAQGADAVHRLETRHPVGWPGLQLFAERYVGEKAKIAHESRRARKQPTLRSAVVRQHSNEINSSTRFQRKNLRRYAQFVST